MTVVSPQRLHSEVVALAHRGLNVRDYYAFGRAALLARRLPFEGFCLLTLDPATLLPTGEVVENGLPQWAMPRLTEIELAEQDFNKFTASPARQPASTLSEATVGDLDRSLRHRELKRPSGFRRRAARRSSGDSRTWGGITLLRQLGDPPFTSTDASLLASCRPA